MAQSNGEEKLRKELGIILAPKLNTTPKKAAGSNEARAIIKIILADRKQHELDAKVEEWVQACRDNWQTSIPEQYALNHIKALRTKEK